MRTHQPQTHDYTRMRWGHSVSFISISDDGRSAKVLGHGFGVKEGDFLLLSNGSNATTRYRIAKWEQKRPSDCWGADIEFAPREVTQ